LPDGTTPEAAPQKAEPGWLKPSIDYGPVAIFFLVYLKWDLITATGALMAATVLALGVSLIVAKRVPTMPLITAVIVGIFGGLTLWLQDERFIKMKPTIVEAMFSIVLFAGLAFRKPLLKPLMEAAWPMDDEGWTKLTWRFAWFFAAMAVLNEIVWRNLSTEIWVSFKVFGLMILTLAFAVFQAPLMRRHMIHDDRDKE
jgi:intracellular septation protein